MSGGSYDYAFGKIEDLAGQIRQTTPLRKAFVTHLRKVAKACHDIEWVDSGDCGPGEEYAAIRACLGKSGPALVLAEVLAEAGRVKADLEAVLDAALARTGAPPSLDEGDVAAGLCANAPVSAGSEVR
jgi:hypothetical protein